VLATAFDTTLGIGIGFFLVGLGNSRFHWDWGFVLEPSSMFQRLILFLNFSIAPEGHC